MASESKCNFKFLALNGIKKLEFCVLVRMDGGMGDFKFMSGKPIGKMPLGRPTRGWEDNIRMVLHQGEDFD